MYFNIDTDVAQDLINDFFSNFDCQNLSIGRFLSEKKTLGYGVNF